jgi:class 3 adenylate cyclase/tetratricopeptide (TPR) repeat protein
MASWLCASCRGENPEGMRFCGHCGTPRPAEAAAAEPVVAEAEPADEREAALTAFASDRIDPGGAGMTEERRLITALFADLSGFTPLSEKLDAEELLEVIDPIITALSDLVGRYGGYVEKFAGDALLALFGAPVAHEDDATRALLVSIEMHRELDALRGQLGEHGDGLTLHIGIASGRGIARMIGSKVRMDYAVLGDSVILAQRLESATPSGQTYVSASTQALVQDRFELEPVPPLTLKGKAQPVPAWRLLGPSAAAEQRSALMGRPRVPLVGRERELERLTSLLDRLGAGEPGGTVTVVGEPGVGKSRLTDELRSEARARGIAWHEARGVSFGGGLAYWPFLELLRREFGIGPDDAGETARARISSELAALGVPEIAPVFARLAGITAHAAVMDLEPEAFRRGLHDAVRRWLLARAANGPLVLAIEDAHWADAASAALAESLVSLAGEGPIGLYVTSRAPAPTWLSGAEGVIHLEPLDADGLGRLVEHALDGAPPAQLSAIVADRSAGNPFFAHEIVRSLQDSGALERGADGRWQLRSDWDADDVPATVEGVLAARIDALSTPAQHTLAMASVIGRTVPLPLLQGVAGSGVAVEHDLAELLEAGLLDPAPSSATDERRVLFHHALISEVSYGRLLRRQRRELHRRTAEIAEALYGSGDESIELLARHLYLGAAGPKAIDYLVRASRRAAALFANDGAIVHLRRAAELARAEAHDARLVEILLRLGDLQELVGAYDEARAAYVEAREEGGDVRAWRGLASVLRTRGEYHAALELLNEAFDASSLAGQDLRALWLERGWNLSSTERMTDAIAALNAGLAARPAAGDPMEGQLLVELARAESYAGRLEAALGHAEGALRIARDGADLRGETTALRVLGLVQQGLGRLEEAAVSLRRDLELARRIGSVEAIGGALINLGLVERDRGDLAASITCNREAVAEFERVGHGAGRAIGYANLADGLRRARELDEAEAYARRAHDLAEEIGHAMTRADSVAILGEISYARGAHLEAAQLAEASAELFLAADARPGAAEAYELAERAWRASGDAERAAESAARYEEMAGEPLARERSGA